MICRGTIIQIVKTLSAHRLISAVIFIVFIGLGAATWFARDWSARDWSARDRSARDRSARDWSARDWYVKDLSVGLGSMAISGPGAPASPEATVDPKSWCEGLLAMMEKKPPAVEAIRQLFFKANCERYALSPNVQSSPVETVDLVLKRLVDGVVAFNVPDRMRLARSQTLEARLGVNVPREQLVQEITTEGEVKTAKLQVSPRMQATLSGGSAFDISPSGPQVQFVSNEASNVWHWQVTPKLEGRQVLELTFDAFIEVGGEKGIHTVKTLEQPIIVDVSWPETPQEWAEWFKNWVEYGGWLWTALLLPVGVFTLRKWRKFHHSAATDASLDDPNG